ncbi:3-deoxy-7-phosphoheptulonate synthase [Streptomyces sp. NPDC097107]|uniref:3-deoxy-7-phosphoheptulonate synthase n=1 Tax=Streptomyces sp. NPDC097107 TaxID=3366089 RepID=UPI0038031AFB
MDEWRRIPAHQQPVWEDSEGARESRRRLTALPALVEPAEIDRLRDVLSRCVDGSLSVVQVGSCAEDPRESARESVRRLVGLIEALAGTWQLVTGTPVVRVGRMAGQYAKPRSQPTEMVDGRRLAVFRGHMVNRPEPGIADRRHLPDRMLHCYESSAAVLSEMRRLGEEPSGQPHVWTSHEALVLDYELALLRRDSRGRTLATSTHWPWVGERTRQLDHAHVRMLASIGNPVACKLGPTATPEDVRGLCQALNPRGEPGRLTLIARMGADRVADLLPPLVTTALDAQCPVLWLCDPMHANTRSQGGFKTRLIEDITTELQRFYHCVTAAGGVPGGIHLEATSADVVECVSEAADTRIDPARYTSLCDPRLNPSQAQAVLEAAAHAAMDETED